MKFNTNTFKPVDPLKQLRRAVLSCMMLEDQFYEKGSDLLTRIDELVKQCRKEDLIELIIEAKEKYKLRHISLYLCIRIIEEKSREVSNGKLLESVRPLIKRIVTRPDEMGELLAIYWRKGKRPIAKQLRRGLADCFAKFDEHQFSKWDKNKVSIKIRDIMFLVHPEPKGHLKKGQAERETLYKNIANNTLPVIETWETMLSAGKDKAETFTALLLDRKIGYTAMLRNLRNMKEAGVDSDIVKAAILDGADTSKELPSRFIAAARYCPEYERELDQAMEICSKKLKGLEGKTHLLIDVSGSMNDLMSSKSKMTRMDSACSLAVLLEYTSDCKIYSFSNRLVEIAPRRGMALVDAIIRSQPHSGTNLGAALNWFVKEMPREDRLIVITDEQSHDVVPDPINEKCYIINVASYEKEANNKWNNITGLSEAVFDYISELESDLAYS